MQPTSDLTTKLIIGLSVIMTLMMAFVIYTMMFQYDDPWAEQATADRADDPFACDANDLDKLQCPPGYFCMIDSCQPIAEEALCDEDESCRQCACKPGLVCHHNRCVDETKVDRTPLECKTNEKLADAVSKLADKCSKRSKSIGDIVSAGSCSGADWQQLALEDDKFDLLLAAFPNRFAVLFPPGRPFLKKQDWPTPAIREHYLEQIRKFSEPLVKSKQIFVIGRSSPDGNPETNRLLSLRRMAMVGDLIDVVLRESPIDTKKGEARPMIRSFALASENPIDPAHFKESYLGDSSNPIDSQRSRLVLGEESSRSEVEGAIEGGVDLEKRGTPEWQKLYGALNRVVLVIPIPCTGEEYEPPKTVLEAKAPSERK